jgi:hypothetical protein
MPAGTTTAARTITVGDTDGVARLETWINIFAQANDVTIQNAVDQELFVVPAGKRYRVYVIFGGVHWNLSCVGPIAP